MNFPRSSRFAYNDSPRPSCQRIFAEIASATPKNVEIAAVRVALQLLLNLKRQTVHAATHVRAWPAAIHTRTPLGIGIIVRPEHSEPAEVRRRRRRCPRVRGSRSRVRSRSLRASAVTRSSPLALVLSPPTRTAPFASISTGKQNRAVSHGRVRRARQPSPGEEQALRHPVPSSDLAHHGPWRQRLFDNPRLLRLAPPSPALDPENFPDHLCVTLRLALRSHPPRRPPIQQGGRRRWDTIFRALSDERPGDVGRRRRRFEARGGLRRRHALAFRRGGAGGANSGRGIKVFNALQSVFRAIGHRSGAGDGVIRRSPGPPLRRRHVRPFLGNCDFGREVDHGTDLRRGFGASDQRRAEGERVFGGRLQARRGSRRRLAMPNP